MKDGAERRIHGVKHKYNIEKYKKEASEYTARMLQSFYIDASERREHGIRSIGSGRH